MNRVNPFNENYVKYDKWFAENKKVYLSELQAVRMAVPPGINGLEVGVGTGRFAQPLGIRTGVDPSPEMLKLARKRGINAHLAKAESLPFKDLTFDFILMVNTICFFDDVIRAFRESFRVLKNDGKIIVAFINRNSFLGQQYELKKEESKFYRHASFYSPDEINVYLSKAGFSNFKFWQTLFDLDNTRMQPVLPGYGEGGFVVVTAEKVRS